MRLVAQSNSTVNFFSSSATGATARQSPRGDHADDHVDVLALDQVAVLGDDFGRAAGLVDVDELDGASAEAFLLVARDDAAFVEGFGQQVGGVLGGHAEGTGCGARQEGDHADAQRLLGLSRRGREQGGGEHKGERAEAAQDGKA